ncbi:putative RNA recognition motif domain, nucleotide-binding alpha-beta plait domain superfamily [Helianthus annuus]|uniref:RNA recognition motif domain, nucleotide-binding alpha-beta plait domain superfamily n=1 Tax=Helianthus annuus TaxID=4232 RepID=A0A9K3NK55_HELAN|nr:putative RNA recognition motif domain, nucleotide-binding alpha-beta plait domain superfamily [Helianthus annuus]KAJ0560622.1 putative RNA recognition motif domain, nucleotide-binding alpha-beta plait domain superfamily [Helianthus annuus]
MEFENNWGGNEVDDERPWTDVQYGKNRKSRGDGVEITFLVQNLPERTTKEILWRSFQPHGFVTDAYVARKKDKKGNFFGFVRFVGVGNVGETIQQMNTVKIFEAKVTVSLAKYDKNHKKFIYTPKVMGEKVWKPKEPVHRSEQGTGVNPPGGAAVREGRSFASLFQKEGHASFSESKMLVVEGNGSKYPLHCRGRSIHGVVKDLPTLNNLNSILSNGGLANYGLSYIGGLSILLTLGNPGNVRETLNNHSELLSSAFSRYHGWNGEDLPLDRVATLRITGVPVHLKENSLFDRIGSLFGRVVQESSFSWLGPDNSDSIVKVLVPPGKRIEETVVMQWKDRRFVVWVSETMEVWSPDLEDENDSEDSGSDSESENNDDVFGEAEEVEEGEIRPDGTTVDHRKASRTEPSPEVEKSPSINSQEGMHEVHGGVEVVNDIPMSEDDVIKVSLDKCENNNGRKENVGDPYVKEVRDNCLYEETNMDSSAINDDNVENIGFAQGKVSGGGPHYAYGTRIASQDGPINSPGPCAPATNGKRTRDQRSPPSVGSTQGPHIRIRHAGEDSVNNSLDLNRSIGTPNPGDDVATDNQPAQNPEVDSRDRSYNGNRGNRGCQVARF